MNSTTLRELATRTNDGFTVELLWLEGETECVLRVSDSRSGNAWELPVPGADAIVAFHHPFAYAG